MYLYINVHVHLFLLCQQKDPKINDIPKTRSIPSSKEPHSLEKWLIPGIRQRRYKMSLKYLVLPKRKKCSESVVSLTIGHTILFDRTLPSLISDNFKINTVTDYNLLETEIYQSTL